MISELKVIHASLNLWINIFHEPREEMEEIKPSILESWQFLQ